MRQNWDRTNKNRLMNLSATRIYSETQSSAGNDLSTGIRHSVTSDIGRGEDASYVRVKTQSQIDNTRIILLGNGQLFISDD